MTFGVYFQVIHQPFSNYDDGEYVSNNPDIQNGFTRTAVRWAITSTDHTNWHPLTWLSHTLDWQPFSNDPSGHHFTSLLLHSLNVVLLFSSRQNYRVYEPKPAGGRTFRGSSHQRRKRGMDRRAEECAVHAVLSTFADCLRAIRTRPNLMRYMGVVLLFALALASKPMVVTFPFVLLPVKRCSVNSSLKFDEYCGGKVGGRSYSWIDEPQRNGLLTSYLLEAPHIPQYLVCQCDYGAVRPNL